MSTTTLVMDKACRVVVPKSLRKELHLQAGDSLTLETTGEQIMLRPVREASRLVKERGSWVSYSGREPATLEMLSDLIDQMRIERSVDAGLGE